MAKSETFYVAILAGGGGERFWPFSTAARPKQFLTLFGGTSLLRQAVLRLKGLVPPERILIITGKMMSAAVMRELPMLPKANVIAEPCRRDTGAAVATACGCVMRLGGEHAVCAILTADQLMADGAAFRATLLRAVQAARKYQGIVTMGIKPTRPATQFGYIRRGKALEDGFYRVRAFVEKPDATKAARYLKTGEYAWNAGMFVWPVSVMARELKTYAPDLGDLVLRVADLKRVTARALVPLYEPLTRISIDYAVMEHTKAALTCSGDFGWDDVGTWAAAEAHLPHDEVGNVCQGDVLAIESEGCVVAAEKGMPRVAAFGVKDLVIAATPAGILVMPKSRAADLKRVTGVL